MPEFFDTQETQSAFAPINSQEQVGGVETISPIGTQVVEPLVSNAKTYETVDGYYGGDRENSRVNLGLLQDEGRMSPIAKPIGMGEDVSFWKSLDTGAVDWFSGVTKSLVDFGVLPETARSGIRSMDRFKSEVAGDAEKWYQSFRDDDIVNWFKYSAGRGTGQSAAMLPLVLASGGVAAAAKLGPLATKLTVGSTQFASTFMSIFGQTLEDMNRSVTDPSVSESAKWGMAFLSALSQSVIESGLGGQERLVRAIGMSAARQNVRAAAAKSGASKFFEEIGLSFMGAPAMKVIESYPARVLKNGVFEGLEEIGQTWVNDLATKALNPDHEITPLDVMIGREFAGGFAPGMLMGGFFEMTRQKKANLPNEIRNNLINKATIVNVMSKLSEPEKAEFVTALTEFRDSLLDGGVQSDAVTSVVDIVQRLSCAVSLSSGISPAEPVRTFSMKFANRDLTAQEFAEYRFWDEKKQMEFLTKNGIIGQAEAAIDKASVEQVEKMAEAQDRQSKAKYDDADKAVQLVFDSINFDTSTDRMPDLKSGTSISISVLDDAGKIDGNRSTGKLRSELAWAEDNDRSVFLVTKDKKRYVKIVRAGRGKAYDQAGVRYDVQGMLELGATFEMVPTGYVRNGAVYSDYRTLRDKSKKKAAEPASKAVGKELATPEAPVIMLPDGVTRFAPGTWVPIDALPPAWFRYLYVEQGLRGAVKYDNATGRVFIPEGMNNPTEIVLSENPEIAGADVVSATKADMDELIRRKAIAARKISDNAMREKLNAEVDEILGRRGLPLFQKHSMKPVREQIKQGARRVVLAHWTIQSGLTSLNPNKEGTGFGGAELQRRDKYPDKWVNRIHLGGPQYSEETVQAAPYKYRASVDTRGLYDPIEDRDGLIAKARSMSEWQDPDEMLSIFEGLVKKAGYDGMLSPGEDDVVIMFRPVKVQAIPKNRNLFQTNPLAERAAQVSTETRWGSTYKTGRPVFMDQGDDAVMIAFDNKIQGVLTDQDGDILAREVGLKYVGRHQGTGVYEEERNPSTQVQLDLSSHIDEATGEINQDGMTMLDAYSAAVGIVTKQNAMAWNYVVDRKVPDSEHNGAVIRLEKRGSAPLTKDEMVTFVDAMNKEFGPGKAAVVTAPGGMRVFNIAFNDETHPNSRFQEAISKVVNTVDFVNTDDTVLISKAKIQSNYFERGEYEGKIRAHRGVSERVLGSVGRLSERVATATDEFTAEQEAGGRPALTQSNVPRFRFSYNKLVEDALSMESWRDWYDRHTPIIRELFGEDAELFKQILAATSAHTLVKSNVTLAIQEYENLKRGDPIGTRFPAHVSNLQLVRDGVNLLNGPKISEMNRAMLGDEEAVVIDMHMAELFFGVTKPTNAMIEKGKEIVRTVASRLGWTPRETQAALWAVNHYRRMKQELKDKGENELLSDDELINITRIPTYAEELKEKSNIIRAFLSEFLNSRGKGRGVRVGSEATGRSRQGTRSEQASLFQRSAEIREGAQVYGYVDDSTGDVRVAKAEPGKDTHYSYFKDMYSGRKVGNMHLFVLLKDGRISWWNKPSDYANSLAKEELKTKGYTFNGSMIMSQDDKLLKDMFDAADREIGAFMQKGVDVSEDAASVAEDLPTTGMVFEDVIDYKDVALTKVAYAYGTRIQGDESAISNLIEQRKANLARFVQISESEDRNRRMNEMIKLATLGQLYREATEAVNKDMRGLFQSDAPIEQQMEFVLTSNKEEGAIPTTTYVNEAPVAGQYFTGEQVAVFFKASGPDTIVHEFFHHLRTGGYLSSDVEASILSATGHTEWTVEAEEAAADSILAFLDKGEIGPNADGKWVESVMQVRRIFAKYASEVRRNELELNPDTDNLFSRILQESDMYWQKVATEEGAEIDGTEEQKDSEVAKAVDSAVRNTRSLFQTPKVSGFNLRRFHVARKVFESKTGRNARELLESAGLKSYVYARDAAKEGVKQSSDMTNKELSEAAKLLEEQPETVGVTVQRIESDIKKMRSNITRLNKMDPKHLAGELEAKKNAADAEAEILTAELKKRPETEDMRLRRTGGTSFKYRARQALKWVANRLSSTEEEFRYLDDGDYDGMFSKAFWRRVWKASSRHAARFVADQDYISATIKKLGGIPENLLRNVVVEGRNFKLTQLIGIYMHSEGGNVESGSAKAMMENNEEVNADVIRKAKKIVESDPKSLNFVRVIQAYMQRVYPELLSVAKSVLGRDIGNLGRFYLPFVYEDGNIAEMNGLELLEGLDVKGPDVSTLMRTPSQLKKREGSRGGRLELDSLKLFMRYVESTGNYIEKAETVQHLLWMLNNYEFSKEIALRYGNDMVQTLKTLVSRELSPTGRTDKMMMGEAKLQQLRSRANVSYLGLNPFTMLNQPVSMFNAMAEIDVSSGIGNLVKMFAGILSNRKIEGDADFERMIKESPVMKLRARYGMVDPEFDNMMRQRYQSTAFAEATKSKNQIIQIAANGMNGIRLFDLATTTAVYTTARDSKLAEGASLSEAIEYAERVVRKTQSPTVLSERSIMQSSNEYVKSAIMFSGQLFKNLNQYAYDIVLPIVQGYRGGGATGMTKALWDVKKKILFAVIVPSLAMGMLARRRPQETAKEFWLDLLVYPLTTFPIVGSGLASGLQGFSQSAYRTVWTDCVNAVNGVIADHVTGKKEFGNVDDIWDDAKKMERLALTLLGAPQYPFTCINRLVEEMRKGGTIETSLDAFKLAFKVANAEPRDLKAFKPK